MRGKANSFTKAEKSWILYDWANSVYATNMTAAIFPIYYATVAGDEGHRWWGLGVSAASLLVAVLAPVLGAAGDTRGMKKKLLAGFLLLGVGFTAVTAYVASWQWMLIGYVLSHIGFSGANVFYDAFLTDVTTRDRMDKVSAWGYAMGYLGGSTVPFVLSIAALLFTGFSVGAVKFSILLTSVWWAVFSLPLLINVKQTHFTEVPSSRLLTSTWRNLRGTLGRIRRNRGLHLFLLAYFFYIDGVNTVISLATNYGATLGLGSTGMILALLVTQLVAVPCSLLFSRLSRRIHAVHLITAAIAVYFIICGVGFFMGWKVEPYQLEYTAAVNEAAVPPTLVGKDAAALRQVLGDIREEGKDALAAADRGAAFYAVDEAGRETGVLGDVLTRLRDPASSRYGFTKAAYREEALHMVERMKPALLAFAQDAARQEGYRRALAVSSRLFWLMAVLVGTVQGGIQALSRSFFGKLVPPERSNEYFGFFDIIGKFAAVTGPGLYALFYMLTGRASMGIISLLLLFAAGGSLLIFGRRTIIRSGQMESPPA